MAILKILTAPNSILTTKAGEVKEINTEVRHLIKDLKETLAVQDEPEGVGIAATQVGKPWRLFLVADEITKAVTVYINPEITYLSKESFEEKHPEEDDQVMEGCLSVPDIYGKVRRSNEVELTYMNEEGQIQEEHATGLRATFIQHEYDHIEGILFTQRVLAEGNDLYRVIGDNWHKLRL